MDNQPFTKREIELLFARLEDKMDALLASVADTNTHFDKRLSDVENDVKDLQQFQVKAMTLWSIVTALGATLISFFLNRFV